MNWVVMCFAGVATVSVGEDLLKAENPPLAHYVVFAVAAGFLLASMVIEALGGGDE